VPDEIGVDEAGAQTRCSSRTAPNHRPDPALEGVDFSSTFRRRPGAVVTDTGGRVPNGVKTA